MIWIIDIDINKYYSLYIFLGKLLIKCEILKNKSEFLTLCPSKGKTLFGGRKGTEIRGECGYIMEINVQRLGSLLRERNPGMDEKYAEEYADHLVRDLDERLRPNLLEWMEGKEITNIWIGKYCVNAIMSIREDKDFLGALEAMNTYLQDEEKGVSLIWRGRR